MPKYKNGKPVRAAKVSWYDTLAAVTTTDGDTTYGYPREVDGEEVLDVVQLDYQGHPVLGTKDRQGCAHADVRSALTWAGAAIRVAELTYPHASPGRLDPSRARDFRPTR